MRRGRKARMGLAGGAALAIHLCVLTALAMRTSPLPLRQYDEDALMVALVAPIYLPRRSKPQPPNAPRPRPVEAPDIPIASLPMAPSEPPPAPSATPATGQAPTPALNGDVGQALRRRLGCARTDQADLSREDRLACQDALSRGARQVAALGQAVPAEKKAYYDAVKAARQGEGHGPGIGCHIRFGGGKPAKVDTPAHGLQLGPLPCFVIPPAGMLSPEADIPNPY